MPMIKVKEKFQVTIPNSIRKESGLAVGDYLEAVVEDNKIILKPKTIVDREKIKAAIEAGLQDYEEGNVSGPFKNMAEYRKHKQSQKKNR